MNYRHSARNRLAKTGDSVSLEVRDAGRGRRHCRVELRRDIGGLRRYVSPTKRCLFFLAHM